MIISEFVQWSPVLGEDTARISTANENGQEYFILIPFGYGKAYRELRSKAAYATLDAIENGQAPGEVFLPHDDD